MIKRGISILLSLVVMLSGSFTLTSYGTTKAFDEDSYTHNTRFVGLPVHNGIDVSQFQYDIDWERVSRAGVEFAIIRSSYRGQEEATFGQLKKDPYFERNLSEAKKYGIKIGVYHYSQALDEDEAKEEAAYVVGLLDGENLNLPIFIDIEEGKRNKEIFGTAPEKKKNLSAIIEAFCDEVRESGYEPGLYANTNNLLNCIYTQSLADDGIVIWDAQYKRNSDYSGTYDIWQYADRGYIDGIYVKDAEGNENPVNVDHDFIYGDKFGLEKDDSTYVITTAGKVTGFVKKTRSKSSYTLKWNGQSSADGYNVYRQSKQGGKYVKIATTENSTYKDSGLDSAREYSYKVSAFNQYGEADASKVLKATVLPSYDRYGKLKCDGYIRSNAGTSYSKVKLVGAGRNVIIYSYILDKNWIDGIRLSIRQARNHIPDT